MPNAILAGTLSAALIVSGAMKVRQPGAFRRFMFQSPIGVQVPARLSHLLPALEVAVGLCLLVVPTLAPAIIALVMTASFVVAAGVSAATGVAPGCGCFGDADADSPHWLTLTRASAFVLLAAGAVAAGTWRQPMVLLAHPAIAIQGVVIGLGMAAAGIAAAQTVAFSRWSRAMFAAADS